jgi:hypothetical protein
MNILLCICMVSASTGIIITDNVLFYEGDLKITTLMIGDTVTIDGYCGDTAQVFLNRIFGTLLKGVLIDLGQEIAEEQLFVFSRGYYDEGCFAEAARLFFHFLYFYPGSRYYPEALFYTGLACDELACQGADYDTIPGIQKNEQSGRYYYTGNCYQRLLEEYPADVYATSAAYYLILCQRAAEEPWNGATDKIEQDLHRLQNVIDTYGKFAERAAVLEEIGYDYRALYEITSEALYRDQAVRVFKTVIQDYPAGAHEASARVHLFEIENNIPIYLY